MVEKPIIDPLIDRSFEQPTIGEIKVERLTLTLPDHGAHYFDDSGNLRQEIIEKARLISQGRY